MIKCFKKIILTGIAGFVALIVNGQTQVSYIRTWDAVAPEINPEILMARPLKDVRQSTQYLDGLGRPVQMVIRQGSFESTGSPADLVSPIVYDNFGREQYKYLPFVANNAGGNSSINDGLFKTNALEQQQAFGQSQYPGETFYYGLTDFESSPLNRINKTTAPGNSWAGSGVGVGMNYWANTVTDDVKKWTVTEGGGNPLGYSISGSYSIGALIKNVTVDEHGKQVIEFKDKGGKVILKKVQLSASADDGSGSGYTGWLCTYYIYDDIGNLRCVLQPAGTEIISTNSWALTDATILAEQCFRYEYDDRNRMVVKKVPGAGEIWMVYDARDRLVLTQDANLRAQGKWMYTQYDAFNRPTATGLWNNGNDRGFHSGQAINSSNYPDLSGQSVEELSKVFYDNYNWLVSYGNPVGGSYNASGNAYFQSASNNDWPYAQANTPAQSSQLKGLMTGTRTQVSGTSNYLYTASVYDEKGKVIQVQSTNITGGTDMVTTLYTWAGQPLVMVQQQVTGGAGAQTNIVVTQMTYDNLGRVSKTEKKISSTLVNGGAMPAYKIIAQNEYDKLGQIKNKKLAPAYNNTGLETINYDYNIRGWLLGTNRAYLATTGQAGTTKFGFELSYDKLTSISGHNYTGAQNNGNIAGMMWKSDGDDVRRKYNFNYDAVNRFMKGTFEQDDAVNTWNSTTMNYTVQMGNGANPFTAYDANGNIKAMKQYGWKLGNPGAIIDDLTYNYITNTNKLLNVIDGNNVPLTKLGDFRTSALHPEQNKTTSTVDYTYDANGNLKKDLNKDIGTANTEGIIYNHLNLPKIVTVRKTGGVEKGTITYTYDASGNKIKKVVTEFGVSVPYNGGNHSSDITITTSYIAGFVYESKAYSNSVLESFAYTNKLQFTGHEEGRIRFKEAEGTVPASFQYDYMLKDHLGNVRMVLTEEQRTDAYPPASMELAQAGIEEAIYANIASHRTDKPSGFPSDPYTDPNDKIAVTHGGGKEVGPSVTLRVMAGDKFNLRVNSYYKTEAPLTPPLDVSYLINHLLNSLASGIGNISGTHGSATTAELTSSGVLLPGATNFANSLPYDNARPKSYLNWILFDEQFNYVSSCSGADQVGNSSEYKTHLISDLPITKNGYLYVYVSNQTPGTYVYFDNLQITHIRGPILEETHYYPFGLSQAGISSKALGFGGSENKKKFNGIEHNNDFDMNMYDAFYRNLDPQIGRFWQVDPKIESAEGWSPYSAMLDNPIRYADPLGDSTIVPTISLKVGKLPPLSELNAHALVRLGVVAPKEDPRPFGEQVMGDLKLAAMFAGAFGAGIVADAIVVASKASEASSNPAAGLQKEMGQLEKSNRTTEKLIKEHKEKLENYKSDPKSGDNKGILEGKTKEMQEKIIDGRIKRLEKEIQKFEKNIEKNNNQIKDIQKQIQQIKI